MYWAERPSMLLAPANEPDPAKRAFLVLKWFLSTLKQQYAHRPDRKKGKPLNPFLGELFLGHWDGADGNTKEGSDGTTHLVSEQVSHHPPTTAFRLWNELHGVRLEGYYAISMYFDRTIHIKRIGYAILHLEKYNEDYLVTVPGVHLEGFFPPPPVPEIDRIQPSYIESSSGFTAKIIYSGKGWLRGKRNSFSATLYPKDKESEPIYTAEGQWSGSFTMKDVKTDEDIETFDTTTPITPMILAPLDEQDPLESRKAWSKVSSAIKRRDLSAVGTEKSRIEVRQREMRKAEQLEGREWPRRYFSQAESDPRLEGLLAWVGEKLEPEKTGGIWKWDEQKYQKWREGSGFKTE